MRFPRFLHTLLLTFLAGSLIAGSSFADDPKPEKKKPEYPSLDKVTKDYTKVEGLSLIHISEPTRPY